MFKNWYITDVDLSFAFPAKYIYFSKLNTSLENIFCMEDAGHLFIHLNNK